MVSTRHSTAAEPSPEQEPAKATPVQKERSRAAKVAKDGEQSTPGKAGHVSNHAKLKSKRAKRRARVAARLQAEGLSRRAAKGTATVMAGTSDRSEEGKQES